MRILRACAELEQVLGGQKGGLSIGCPSFDPAHWLRGGTWAGPATDWSTLEQLGPHGPMDRPAGGADARRLWAGIAVFFGHGFGEVAWGRDLHRAGQHRGHQVL